MVQPDIYMQELGDQLERGVIGPYAEAKHRWYQITSTAKQEEITMGDLFPYVARNFELPAAEEPPTEDAESDYTDIMAQRVADWEAGNGG